MKNNKIKSGKGKVAQINELFKTKEKFHRNLSKLPFEEKIEILMKMQRIVELKRMS